MRFWKTSISAKKIDPPNFRLYQQNQFALPYHACKASASHPILTVINGAKGVPFGTTASIS
jgi:hypothetical protein